MSRVPVQFRQVLHDLIWRGSNLPGQLCLEAVAEVGEPEHQVPVNNTTARVGRSFHFCLRVLKPLGLRPAAWLRLVVITFINMRSLLYVFSDTGRMWPREPS